MMNNVMLVGRPVKTPEITTTDNGWTRSYITLAVNRSYKNQDGEYETDFLDCTLWSAIAEKTAQYCKAGDTIGVFGKLQSRIIENDDGTKYKRVDVVADRVSFISSKKIDSKETDDHKNNGLEPDTSYEIMEDDTIKQDKKEKKK